MNATLKQICGLLKNDNAEIQKSAAIVLSKLTPHDSSVLKTIGESLIFINDKDVALTMLKILQHDPQEKSIKYILEVVDKGIIEPKEVYDIVAAVGRKAIPVLKKIYAGSSLQLKLTIIEILPRIRNEAALGFLIDQFFNDNAEVVRACIHALRENIAAFNKKENALLNKKLKSVLSSSKTSKNLTALSAVIISMGITGDIKCKKLLLKYVSDNYDLNIRRHALMSLSSLSYATEGHGDLIKALLPIINDDDSELVKLSVDVLSQIRPRKSDTDVLIKILENHKESYVQAFAVKAIGKLDTVDLARRIIDLMWHKDRNIQKAAAETLVEMKSAGKAILDKIDNDAATDKLEELIAILKHHKEKINPERIKSMITRMFECLNKNDAKYTVYRNCLVAIDGDQMQKAVLKKASAARRKRDYDKVRQSLQLLKGTDYMTEDLRMSLAVAKLKTSRKNLNRESRLSDYSLEMIGKMLKDKGKEFIKSFYKQNELNADDYFYVGYHFMEKLHEERRFGVECLQYVISKWGNTKTGQSAKKKLKEEKMV